MKMTRRSRMILIAFLGIMSAMAPLATDMYLPALPELSAEFSASTSATQLTLTMTLLGMAVGQIFLGPLSDMYGRKRPLFAGMIAFSLVSAGCFYASSIEPFLALRFLQGFAGASGLVISRAIARDVAEGIELTRFMAILMLVNGLAPILAPVAGGQILAFSSWRIIFAVLAVIGVLLAVWTLKTRETLAKEERQKNMAASFHAFPALLRDRYFFGHCLVQCFVFASFFSYIAGSSFVFQNIYGISAQGYSLIFGGIGTGLFLVGGLPARLAGHVKDVTMLKASLLVPLVGSSLLLAAFLTGFAPLALVIVLLFITIVPLSVMGTASFSLALSRQGRNAGAASALIGFFSMALGGVMMPLVGIAGDATAIPMAGLMFAGYTLGALVFYRRVKNG
nr:multidrug effflux MFS transporter [uncultured Selenomonas sp.]